MRFFRFIAVAFVVCFAVLALSSRVAWAQSSCSPSTESVTGLIGTVTPSGAPAHPQNVPVNAINYSDCVNNELLTFTVGTTGISANNIEAWMGAQDCGALTARTGADPTCWQAFPGAQASSTTVTVSMYARDIVSQLSQATKTVTYAQSPESVCNTAQTTDAATTISMYIFIVDPSSNVCGSEITYSVTIDLLAGNVPGTPTSLAGDQSLYVTIPSTTDPDTVTWNVYTDPPPNGAAGADVGPTAPLPVCDAAIAPAVDAGDSGDDGGVSTAIVRAQIDDAGDESGTSVVVDSGPTCVAAPQIDGGGPAVLGDGGYVCGTSAVLVAGSGGTVTDTEAGEVTTGGTQSLVPPQYLGAAVGVTSTQAQITGLTNNITYTVAVAAGDAVGNIGPLALVTQCGPDTTPDPVGGFWYSYVRDGGLAGGGFCSLDAVGTPASSVSFGLAVFGAATVLTRRRKRRS